MLFAQGDTDRQFFPLPAEGGGCPSGNCIINGRTDLGGTYPQVAGAFAVYFNGELRRLFFSGKINIGNTGDPVKPVNDQLGGIPGQVLVITADVNAHGCTGATVKHAHGVAGENPDPCSGVDQFCLEIPHNVHGCPAAFSGVGQAQGYAPPVAAAPAAADGYFVVFQFRQGGNDLLKLPRHHVGFIQFYPGGQVKADVNNPFVGFGDQFDSD